jgi:aspartate-semialdehyde dehydrogenase
MTQPRSTTAVARIAVVGATGLVGRTALSILESRPWLREPPLLQASGQSRSTLSFRGEPAPVGPIDVAALRGADAVLLCAGEEVSRRQARTLAARGLIVVDMTSVWRMAPDVPLVVAPVNLHRLRTDPPSNLLANPNCTAAIAATVVGPLQARWGLRRLAIASYQSASGAGRELLAELDAAPGDLPPAAGWVAGAPLRENVLPWIGPMEGGESLEERKIVDELRKILGLDGVGISATAVRVPTRVGHALAITLWPARDVDPRSVAALLRQSEGVEVWDDDRLPPTPRDAQGRDPVLVARIRRPTGDPEALALWAVGDNLRRGAALNAIELVEARLGLTVQP